MPTVDIPQIRVWRGRTNGSFCIRYSIGSLLLLSAVVMAIGCEKPVNPFAEYQAEEAAAATAREATELAQAEQVAVLPVQLKPDDRPWIAPDLLPWETSYAQYVGNQRIGFSMLSVRPPTLNNQSVRIVRHDFLEHNAQGKLTTVEIELEAVERHTGQLQSFSQRTMAGGVQAEVQGSVYDATLKMEAINATGKTQATVAYGDDVWGVLGVQAMLLHSPIKAGQRREGKVFVPGLGAVVEVELEAGSQLEPTPLVGGSSPELLPVDITMRSDTGGMRSRNWVNERGEIEKTATLTPPIVVTFRIPSETAAQLAAESRLTRLQNVTVELAGSVSELGRAALGSVCHRYRRRRSVYALLATRRSDVELD
ncbi:MAG: hypothetical protein R3C53_01400 [Pirellulaceae bacterium]